MRKRHIAAAAIFAMGIISGFCLAKIHQHFTAKERKESVVSAADRNLHRLSKRLGLSKTQKDSVKRILSAKRRDIINLKAEFRPKYMAIRNSAQEDIRGILDKQQQRQFSTITETAEREFPLAGETPEESPQPAAADELNKTQTQG